MKYGKQADPFYLSGAWRQAREQALIRDLYLCQECLRRVERGLQLRPRHATMVHHIKPRKLYPELALSLDNLESLCNTCHERMTPERHGGKKEKSSTRRVIVIRNEVGRDDRR